MKKIAMNKSALSAALIVLASLDASAQTNPPMTPSAPAAASSASAPVATRKDNRALRKRVYAAFAKDKSIDAGDIGVNVKDGAVTLTGTAADATQIEKAAALARSVPDVTSVTNKLTVRRNFAQ